MKKTLFITTLLISFSIHLNTTYAQAGFGMPGSPGQQRNQNPTINQEGEFIPQGNPGQEKNEMKIFDQTEDDLLDINHRSQEGSNFGLNNARERMSDVAKSVQNLLSTIDTSGGIGRQVSEIAKQQQEAQAQITQTLDEMENRRGFARQIFGPDYAALKQMERVIYQNQNRIQQLQMLKNNIQNEAEEANLQNAIQNMLEQNTALQEQIKFQEDKPGMFGWLIKIFN